ncbi:MAG: hypothetical protein J6386_26075 [Candidatus Synoicihabitans palmerolidicus]|nr:hypothetical protein [Candidatus Synoicihabitans palmerolidicus]MCC5025891.1 hypothetical protein [Candidatus Synoicihabitans palmerolidicus]MCC5025932.1 hypothetical protein [Candidatus Synoicihabitans palmerolidicus]MCC5025971.1 hypothetical protein [Candidatus Synoicihabitans palmerolidicus]MCC5026015.1 hypothetical protein [Candidatus Synoicihabitans palmerolidicus]
MDRAVLYNAISSHTMAISRASSIVVSSATSSVLIVCAFLVIFLQSTAALLILLSALAFVLMTLFSQRQRLVAAMTAVTTQDNVFVARFSDLLDGFKELKMDVAKNREFFDPDLPPPPRITPATFASREAKSAIAPCSLPQLSSFALYSPKLTPQNSFSSARSSCS